MLGRCPGDPFVLGSICPAELGLREGGRGLREAVSNAGLEAPDLPGVLGWLVLGRNCCFLRDPSAVVRPGTKCPETGGRGRSVGGDATAMRFVEPV